jgi:hypothetical protein
MKNRKVTITLSQEDNSLLEKIGAEGNRNNSRAIAWLIFQEGEWLKEQERIKADPLSLEAITVQKVYMAKLEAKITHHEIELRRKDTTAAPVHVGKIIQFPAGYITGAA